VALEEVVEGAGAGAVAVEAAAAVAAEAVRAVEGEGEAAGRAGVEGVETSSKLSFTPHNFP
jgi:hypothetical protein